MKGEISAGMDRAVALAGALLAVTVDLIFLAAVVLLNSYAQDHVFTRYHLKGSAHVSFVVLEWAFAVSTVLSVLSFLLHDLLVTILRPWTADRHNA